MEIMIKRITWLRVIMLDVDKQVGYSYLFRRMPLELEIIWRHSVCLWGLRDHDLDHGVENHTIISI